MLNNKGQSLILFVILLPVLLLVFVLVVDLGNIIVLKQELNNISEIVLDYGLDKLLNVNLDNNEEIIDNEVDNIEVSNEELDINMLTKELVGIVKLNNNDIDKIDIKIVENKIYVELNEKVNGIFSSFVDIPIFDVESSYVGYIENNNKRIERIVGD